MKRLALFLPLLLAGILPGCGITLGYPTAGGAPTNDPNAAGYTIFVTSATYLGNMGTSGYTSGVTAADNLCQTASASTTDVPTGTYRALLLDSSVRTTITQVLTGGRKYVRPDGTIIGTTYSTGGFAQALTNSITAGGVNVWTGMDANGNAVTTNCNNWTDTSSSDTGTLGLSSGTTSGAAFNSQTQACSTAASIYCVEQ